MMVVCSSAKYPEADGLLVTLDLAACRFQHQIAHACPSARWLTPDDVMQDITVGF